MKTRFLLVIFAVIAVSAMAIADGTSRSGGGPASHFGDGGSSSVVRGDLDGNSTACAQAAARMLKSCRFEVKEEYHATVAKCINLGDSGERTDCLDGAAEAKEEDNEGCFDQKDARLDVCDMLEEDLYDPEPLTDDSIELIDPNDIGDSELPNPYFSLEAGITYVLRAGEDFEETIVVHVTDEVHEVLGVDCRIVVDIVLLLEDGEYVAVEATDDLYAQADNGDVYYCGEVSRNYEDGLLDNLDGSFLAGLDWAKSGILIMANPQAGIGHRQEYLLGEAEDVIRYVGTMEAPSPAEGGENPDPDFSCAGNGGCVKTEEFIPPEPESGEFKYFLEGVGFVLGVGLEDGEVTGERDELLCIGDSLDVLSEPDCGIVDLAGLEEELCRLSSAFCDD